jgi:hypothetical protein
MEVYAMIVNDPNVIVGSSGLASVEVTDDKKVVITLKNNSTLTLVPKVADGKVEDYEMVYLTGKENKQIAKIKEKILSLQSQITDIKDGNQDVNQDDSSCDNDNSNS